MHFSPDFLARLRSGSFMTKLVRDKQIVMDNSEFSTWSNCFISGLFYGGVRRVTTQGQAALKFGVAVHHGLAELYKGASLKEALDATQTRATLEDLDACLDSRRTTARALEMVESYWHHISVTNTGYSVAELNGHKMVEQNFCLPLGTVDTCIGEVEIMWSGVIDLLAYYNNQLWVIDHKTTSIMGEKFLDDKLRSSQIHGYTWVANQLCERMTKSVGGTIINALCHRSSGFEFKDFKIPLPGWKIAEWREETLAFFVDLVDKLVNFGSTIVPNRLACVSKYGRCPYFDLCDSPEMVRERNLFSEGFFTDNDWNPAGE